MTPPQGIVVAGAGIGGLTAAFALARNGFEVTVLEQAERLEEIGAGIQLSPNATRTLIALGLGDRLHPYIVVPEALRILKANSGREIVRLQLGSAAASRYGAPYWLVHRGDLQAVLGASVAAERDVSVKLGVRMEDFVVHSRGITVSARARSGIWHERAAALIAADGLWSQTRARLSPDGEPRFAGRTAWRAMVWAKDVAPEFRQPMIYLWLGRDAHLVHYPVKGGTAINIVAIIADPTPRRGWGEPARTEELLMHLPARHWALPALSLVRTPSTWLRWSLYDRPPLATWSKGPVALLGDAAHPVLPFLAQGAGLAIEDAAVAAQCLARMPDDIDEALRTYTAMRRGRAAKVQRAAARAGARYHLGGFRSLARNAAMRAMGGARLLRHYDWLYDWRLPEALSLA